MRKLFYLSLVALVLLLAFSCKKETTNTNAAPVISFVSFTTSSATSAVLTFSFSDVDGNNNLGQQQGDTTGHFSPDSVGYYDFYMRYYWKNYTGHFVTYYYPYGTPPSNGDTNYIDRSITPYHLPYISTNSKNPSINGLITVNLSQYIPPPQGIYGSLQMQQIWDSLQCFRYEFWIYDRQMHKSNIVTTPQFNTNYPLN
jgi:hypothetical protein